MARELCLQAICAHLGRGELDRRFGLSKIHSLANFRRAIAVMDLETHAREVESVLGFGAVDRHLPGATALGGGPYERGLVVANWRQKLMQAHASQAAPRVLWLEAPTRDPLVDQIRHDDLASLGQPPKRIQRLSEVGGGSGLLETLHSYRPQVICASSVYTCKWIETLSGIPLDRLLPQLRLILAGGDLKLHVRASTPILSAGLLHRAGRLTLPTALPPTAAMELAVASCVIELLPHRPLPEVPADQTILPEQAIIGERYELVVSSPLGFLRLRSDEHVRVIGFSPPTQAFAYARPRVIRLPPPPLRVRLEGISIPGAWLAASVRLALRREDPALVAATIGPDPAALRERGPGREVEDPFSETELGRVDPSSSGERTLRPRGLLAQIEVQGQVRGKLARHLGDRIDTDLQHRSHAYAHLRTRGELRGVRVVLVEPGTFRTAKLRRVQALRGPIDLPQVRVSYEASAPLYPSITHAPIHPQ